MIELKINEAPEIMFAANGDLKVILTAPRVYAKEFDSLPKGKELAVQIKEYRKKRSIDANNYFWLLCDAVAQKIDSTKEEIYRQKIKEYGVFEIVPIKAEAVESFKAKWSKNGLGWFCEDMDGCKLEGFKRVMVYFGSSSYNTAEMQRLINSIVSDCHELGIPTMTPKEMQRLCEAYNIN